MEIKKDYALLFNAISDAVEELEEALRHGEKILLMLKKAQQVTEEMYINDDDE